MEATISFQKANQLRHWLETPISIAPLVTLRVIIGAMLLFSTGRFMALGWIHDHYIAPRFHFAYYGFEWVQPLPGIGMYLVHIALIMSSLGVILGYKYRLAATVQFLLFTYTELIDLTYYLNHYYFVSITTAVLIFVPANRALSLDVWQKPTLLLHQVPRWTLFVFQFQLAIVYGYAGLFKINTDWLIHALPLKIWLPANDQLPIVGWIFQQKITPWLFSWAGMLYDLTIVGWLCWPPTRAWAYATVVVFHTLTGLLFQIGVFPLVMVGATLIFFSAEWHEKWQNHFRGLLKKCRCYPFQAPQIWVKPIQSPNWVLGLLTVHLLFQTLFPWRYLLYPGNLFWSEEGYRFSWRVMLMEKAGTATFFVKDRATGREGEVVNSQFLNAHQEEQMATQPDMILQFAHFLQKHYREQGIENPAVRAEVYATLNARLSRLLIDPKIDLTQIKEGWAHKKWILE